MSADEKEPDLFDDEKIVVEAEDEAPKSAEKAESKANSDELSPEDGIKQLKERLETEKRAREEAERRAYEAQQQVQKAQRDVQDGDYQLIVSAIDTTRRNADILKNSYAEAMSVGDYRKAADIHEAISLNSAKLTTLENGKNALEQKLKQPVQPVQPPANDPVESLASQLTPRSAAWVRAHPEVVKDPRSYQRMVGAHNMAMADGHVPDSDSYFEAVEGHLGIRRAAQEPEAEDEIVVVSCT